MGEPLLIQFRGSQDVLLCHGVGGWRGVGNGELDERERDVGMYATYRQRVKRVREKRGSEQERARKRETERERERGGERGGKGEEERGRDPRTGKEFQAKI